MTVERRLKECSDIIYSLNYFTNKIFGQFSHNTISPAFPKYSLHFCSRKNYLDFNHFEDQRRCSSFVS